MKKLLLVLIMVFLLLPTFAAAQTPDELARQQAEEIDLTQIEEFWNEVQRESGDYLPDFEFRDVLNWFRPGQAEGLSVSEVFQGLWRFMWREIYINLNLLGKLLFLAVVASLLKNLEKAFANDSIASLTQAIVYLALIVIAMQSFTVAVNLGRQTVDNMVEIILSVIPLLLVLLASLGNFASAAIFRPLIIFAVNFFATIIRDLAFPMIYLTTILSIVNHFSPRVTVSKLADLFRNVSVWVMGMTMTIFTGLLAVHGVASSVGDAVTIRTAKFMTGAFLPVVGGMLTDAVETVASATLILKNTVHLAGVLLLFYVVVFPLLKILALVFIYKLAAALIQPLGETNLSDSLNTMGNCLALIFAAVAIVSVIFYLSITIIAGAGNTSFMLR
ncbi:stage III sporulation protein AE [Dethiobacter alkaliphilus]|uniref:Stage III sporulation protein AE n=1 Tax=Dethiobacter alkaliphilus AHT 1 TaxID=555088 RepID=C0GE39_DETAL|nr:stage III sporulation protein AE [Dethiobacter alkaliphilus]EEG78333.1 stage III sporulation protein AE [Dethiobacter alkaliphilus AHT 1]